MVIKGPSPFEPEESKETAPGFRGSTTLGTKSSVLYLCTADGS